MKHLAISRKKRSDALPLLVHCFTSHCTTLALRGRGERGERGEMSFEESLKHGGFGEHAIWNMFSKMKTVRSVVDVRDDKVFQEKDVDFLVENMDRQFIWVEVKTDFVGHKSGNIVYELTTSGHTGCFEKTQAKYIVYYFPHAETAHLIDVKKLRNYIYEAQPNLIKMGDNAEGFLLPITDLQKQKVIVRTMKGVI